MAKIDVSLKILRKLVLEGFLFLLLITALLLIEHVWPLYQRGFFCDDQTIRYPYKDDTVPTYLLRLISIGLPLVIILITEWLLLYRIRSDVHFYGVPIPSWLQGFYSAALSFGAGVCFVEIITNVGKHVIGRLRPCFIDVCQPSINCDASQWQNRYISAQEFHCTGIRANMYNEVRKSFPSGHSSLSAYGMIFAALYLYRRMPTTGTRLLHQVMQLALVSVSWFIALSRISDNRHHWSDVLAGYSLGTIVAILVCIFGTELLDTKNHHSPLPQTINLESQQHISNHVDS